MLSKQIDRVYTNFKTQQREWVMDRGERLLRWFEKSIARHSRVGDATFFDPDQFSWIADIEANWQTIRGELDKVLQHTDELPNFQDISTDQYNISKDDRWKTYFFYAYGVKAGPNCDRCPETTRLIEGIPGMKTAFFSILLPEKHIPEHRGPYKGVLRYHLGLRVPEPKEKCRIRVDQDIRHWEEGKSLVFDDSFYHEAWNETDGIRVVLFLDFVRPLPLPLAAINHTFLKLIAWSPFVQDAKKNQEQWDKKLEKLMNRKSSKSS